MSYARNTEDLTFAIMPGETVKAGDWLAVDHQTGKCRKGVAGVDDSGFYVPSGSIVVSETGELVMPHTPTPRPNLSLLRGDEEPDLVIYAGQQTQEAIRRYTQRMQELKEAPVEEMTRTTLRQTRGPKLVFTGRKIAGTEFTTRGREPLSWVFEIWETAGGAYIALTSSQLADREDGIEEVRCTVVEPQDYRSDQALMQDAVMQHYEWSPRAKDMVRSQLKWKLKREIA